MSSSVLSGEGGRLPSHLTFAQAARLLGVSDAAIWHRVNRGTLPSEDVLGTRMIPTLALIDERPSLLLALTPFEILALVGSANCAIGLGEGDKPSFSSFQVVGMYLGLSRLPWPKPAQEQP